MAKKLTLSEKKALIQDKGLNAIEEYFGINPQGLDKNTLNHLQQKARLGMQFEREMNISGRAKEQNTLRVLNLISANKTELKKYVKKTMPQYSPIS